MTTDRANDLQAFMSFIDEQLSKGRDELTLDEAVAEWESLNSHTPRQEGQHVAKSLGEASPAVELTTCPDFRGTKFEPPRA